MRGRRIKAKTFILVIRLLVESLKKWVVLDLETKPKVLVMRMMRGK
jgi:hypothetical protein